MPVGHVVFVVDVVIIDGFGWLLLVLEWFFVVVGDGGRGRGGSGIEYRLQSSSLS